MNNACVDVTLTVSLCLQLHMSPLLLSPSISTYLCLMLLCTNYLSLVFIYACSSVWEHICVCVCVCVSAKVLQVQSANSHSDIHGYVQIYIF